MKAEAKRFIKWLLPHYIRKKRRLYYRKKELLRLLFERFSDSVAVDLSENALMEAIRIKSFRVRFVEIPVNVIATFCIAIDRYLQLRENDSDWYDVLILVNIDKNKGFLVPNIALYTMVCKKFDAVLTEDNAMFWVRYVQKYGSKLCIFNFADGWVKHMDDIKIALLDKQFVRKNELDMNKLFTEEQQHDKKRLFSRLGIKHPYICVFSRDAGYYKCHSTHVNEINSLFSVYRDSKISNYDLMAKAFYKQGYSIIRIGSCVEDSCSVPYIIDYPNIAVSPFNDLAVCSECEFFVGDLSGIVEIVRLFKRPTVCVNVGVVLNYNDLGYIGELMIYQKYYDTVHNRYLSLRDVCEIQEMLYALNPNLNGAVSFWKFLQKKHIVAEKNSAIDILNVCNEMRGILKGENTSSQVVRELREKQRSIIKSYRTCNMSAIYAPVGAAWALENQWFFT